MAKIDLDCVAKEPIVFRLRGKDYEIPEPTLEQNLRHKALIAELDEMQGDFKIKSTAEEPNLKELEKLLRKIRKFEMDLEEKIVDIFVPSFKGHFGELTRSQYLALFELIFPSEDEGKKNPENPNQAADSPGDE